MTPPAWRPRVCEAVRSVGELAAAIVVVAVAPTVLTAQERELPPEGGFLADSVRIGNRVYPYAVHLPNGFRDAASWPVILGLHGAGSRGSDGLRQRGQSLAEAARALPERYPAILVLPQCPMNNQWDGAPLEAALAALDETLARYPVDPDRVYVTGQSMGAAGVLRAVARQPERFAAAVLVAAPHRETSPAKALHRLPLWVFHGELDQVPVERARAFVRGVEEGGSSVVRYTELPGAGHDIFDEVYRREDLPAWLFVQRRDDAARPPAKSRR